MTLIAGRTTYVGSRRYAAQPAEARVARHRAAEAFVVILFAAVADALLYAGRYAARRVAGPVARLSAVAVILGVVLGLVAFLAAGALLPPAEAGVRPAVATPSPTPYPGGWTYGR